VVLLGLGALIDGDAADYVRAVGGGLIYFASLFIVALVAKGIVEGLRRGVHTLSCQIHTGGSRRAGEVMSRFHESAGNALLPGLCCDEKIIEYPHPARPYRGEKRVELGEADNLITI
ncbi:MAG: hypothetical protein R3268_14490, partial [Acidiferrobacterales bacterium]|nr:hypothetical protein [Acidiferrobacterales bacterium]